MRKRRLDSHCLLGDHTSLEVVICKLCDSSRAREVIRPPRREHEDARRLWLLWNDVPSHRDNWEVDHSRPLTFSDVTTGGVLPPELFVRVVRIVPNLELATH